MLRNEQSEPAPLTAIELARLSTLIGPLRGLGIRAVRRLRWLEAERAKAQPSTKPTLSVSWNIPFPVWVGLVIITILLIAKVWN